MFSVNLPIEIREKSTFPKHYAPYIIWLIATAFIDLALVVAFGICKTFFSPALDMPVLILQILAICAAPAITILGRMKKRSLTRTAYRTVMACSALHSIAVISWFSAQLISIYFPDAAQGCWLLLWMPPIMSAYFMYLALLLIRPGKSIKPITVLDVREIGGVNCLWIHRQKTFSLFHDDFVDQRYAFPVEDITSVLFDEGGSVLNIEGTAKYLVWPFHLGDTPNRLPEISETASAKYKITLAPRNPVEEAKVAAFYNAIMSARDVL